MPHYPRSDPTSIGWSRSRSHANAITASIRLAFTPALQHTLLATQTSAGDMAGGRVVTTTYLDYLHPHTRTMRPSTASPIYLCACSQRVLGRPVAPSPLALDTTRQHALLTTQTSTAVVTTTCLRYLHPHSYPNDAPIHGLTDIPPRLLSTGIGCGTLTPRSRHGTATHAARDSNLGSGNHDISRLSTPAYPNDAPIHGLTDIPLRLLSTGIACVTLAPRF
jgi:hypothetical protein